MWDLRVCAKKAKYLRSSLCSVAGLAPAHTSEKMITIRCGVMPRPYGWTQLARPVQERSRYSVDDLS